MVSLNRLLKLAGVVNEDKVVIPRFVYHATYRPYIDSIFKYGLRSWFSDKSWAESIDGVVYCAIDPYIAESYAETSDDVPEEFLDQIVILQIDTANLDHSMFFEDTNVLDDDNTLVYWGTIPKESISIWKTNQHNIKEDVSEYIMMPMDEYFIEDEGFDYYQILNSAEHLVKNSGMNMLRDDEISYVAIMGEQVIGVLYQAIHNDVLTWSIAVSEQHRGQGIAKQLYNCIEVPEFVSAIKAELIPPYTLEKMVVSDGYELVGTDRDFKIYSKKV